MFSCLLSWSYFIMSFCISIKSETTRALLPFFHVDIIILFYLQHLDLQNYSYAIVALLFKPNMISDQKLCTCYIYYLFKQIDG